uniref:V-set immunoregulatory receptor n=1 Tax=Xenopus tropicalis TaxID=8364 RepID=A0A6I8SHK7_XENTR
MEFYSTAYYPTCRLWRGWPLLCLYLACYQDAITAFSVSALYSHITCPEGQNVNLTCTVSGHVADKHDVLFSLWHFSKDKNSNCLERRHIQNTTERDHLHKEHLSHSMHNGAFQITLTNVSQQDSGGYCCYVIEASKKHHTRHYSYIEFQVKTDDLNLYTCMFHSPTEGDNSKDILYIYFLLLIETLSCYSQNFSTLITSAMHFCFSSYTVLVQVLYVLLHCLQMSVTLFRCFTSFRIHISASFPVYFSAPFHYTFCFCSMTCTVCVSTLLFPSIAFTILLYCNDRLSYLPAIFLFFSVSADSPTVI